MSSRQFEASKRACRDRKSGKVAKTAAALLMALSLAGAGPAAADEYDSDRSGHPLRILAYIVHPIGVVLDTLIFRPLHWVGSQPYVKTLVGNKER